LRKPYSFKTEHLSFCLLRSTRSPADAGINAFLPPTDKRDTSHREEWMRCANGQNRNNERLLISRIAESQQQERNTYASSFNA
jgi:hypothetical protein